MIKTYTTNGQPPTDEQLKEAEEAKKHPFLFDEDMLLLQIAQEREGDESRDFGEFVKTTGFSMEELEKLSESVVIE